MSEPADCPQCGQDLEAEDYLSKAQKMIRARDATIKEFRSAAECVVYVLSARKLLSAAESKMLAMATDALRLQCDDDASGDTRT